MYILFDIYVDIYIYKGENYQNMKGNDGKTNGQITSKMIPHEHVYPIKRKL